MTERDSQAGDSSTDVRGNPAEAVPQIGRVSRALRSKALVLYDGKQTPHRSCGIALAETFGLPTAAYQSLRRGGITGQGTCGAIVAGQLILGEILGDPDPTGGVTPELRDAMNAYLARFHEEVDRGQSGTLVCNDLTAPHGDFRGEPRHQFCTRLVGTVAGILGDVMEAKGRSPHVTPTTLLDGRVADFLAEADEQSGTPRRTGV